LQNDKYNNKLIIGYEFELNNLKFKIINIIVEGFADEVVNGMQILITVYVEEIK